MARSSALPAAQIRSIRAALLRWFGKEKRDLPWRRTRDPYAIWVAEIMLQQTRVAAVVPYYGSFIARFPDVRSLARATEEEVLAAWSGLGYYSRARALRACAREMTERHGGRLPAEVEELRALPGIGRYTAGAIASQAFGTRAPVVDGNVRRVLCRLRALPGERGSDEELWTLAETLVDPRKPGDWNQAVMELGATVCTPRAPACERCPLERFCAARAFGTPERFPRAKPRTRSTRVRVAVALVFRRGRVLLERPGPGNPLRGTWDLPAIEIGARASARAALASRLAAHGIEARVEREVARARHSILDRSLRLEAYLCQGVPERPLRKTSPGAVRWLDLRQLPEAAVSGATKKILRASQGAQSPEPAVRTAPLVPRP